MRCLPTDPLKIPSGFASPQRASRETLSCQTMFWSWRSCHGPGIRSGCFSLLETSSSRDFCAGWMVSLWLLHTSGPSPQTLPKQLCSSWGHCCLPVFGTGTQLPTKSKGGGAAFHFQSHLPLLPPGAPLSLARQEAITSTLYVHLSSVHRVELIAGSVCPSFSWVCTKPLDRSLPSVVHLDLS